MTILVTGDSIGVGYAAAMHAPVATVAKVGASSGAIASWPRPHEPVTILIVSAGSNDPRNPALAKNLLRIRQSVTAARVVWLLPRDRSAARAVQAFGAKMGDQCVDTAAIRSRDGIHPASYEALTRVKPTACKAKPEVLVYYVPRQMQRGVLEP